MGAIVIRTRYDEGTESAEVATSGVRIGAGNCPEFVLSVPNEGYSRNASYTLNIISTFYHNRM